jgi:DNA-binding CsgD family transcriptional regulator
VIVIVATGGSYLDPALPRPKQYIEALTPKQEEVLKLIAEGKSKEEICQLLNIKLCVLKTHTVNIRKKRNLKNAVELYRYAIKCYPY